MTDLRNAVRALRATPGFTMVALLVLTLGIGASDGNLFGRRCRGSSRAAVRRARPARRRRGAWGIRQREAARAGAGRRDRRPPGHPSCAAPELLRLDRSSSGCSNRWRPSRRAAPTLRLPGAEPEELVAQRVTASFFDVLRIRPTIGRPFTADNEVDGRHRVAVLERCVLAQPLSQRSPSIVGRTIPLDDGAVRGRRDHAGWRWPIRSGPCVRPICGSPTLFPRASGSGGRGLLPPIFRCLRG